MRSVRPVGGRTPHATPAHAVGAHGAGNQARERESERNGEEEMNCPKCGHDIKEHWEVGCICSCELTEAQALLAAQRHAAAVRLNSWRQVRAVRGYMKRAIEGYQESLRDCGIQRKRRSEQ